METLIEDSELNVHLKDTHEVAEERSCTLLNKLMSILKEKNTARGRSEPRYIYTNLVCEKRGRVVDKMIFFH